MSPPMFREFTLTIQDFVSSYVLGWLDLDLYLHTNDLNN